MKRRRLHLRRERARAVANRHPWIFSGAIAGEEGDADAAIGDLYDDRGELVASGWYSERSQIRLRAMAFGQPFTPDVLHPRIERAVRERDAIFAGETDAARLVHSEGDDLSGLVVDRYAEVAVVEITNAGLEQYRTSVTDAVRAFAPVRSVLLRNNVPPRRLEGLTLSEEVLGPPVGEVVIRENGLSFVVNVREGQKTGFFLDQRENRALVRSLSEGRRVLNVFAYSGAFGVYAAAGGAASVEQVDISAPAIELARRNHELNRQSPALKLVTADAFDYLRRLGRNGEQYDFVICDPPAFAKSRGDVDRAARGYKDVNLQAMRLVAAGGYLMTFSCSGHVGAELFQKIVFAAALDAGREAAIVRRLGAGVDHPISIYCPETEYLKGLLLRVR